MDQTGLAASPAGLEVPALLELAPHHPSWCARYSCAGCRCPFSPVSPCAVLAVKYFEYHSNLQLSLDIPAPFPSFLSTKSAEHLLPDTQPEPAWSCVGPSPRYSIHLSDSIFQTAPGLTDAQPLAAPAGTALPLQSCLLKLAFYGLNILS